MTAEAEIPGGPGSQSYGYGGEPTFPDQPPPQPQHVKGRVQLFVERFVGAVNYNLLVAKAFYFFFFAAFGSLWPLLGVYFKQLGMNPAEGGTLIGFRPFIEFFSAPFWGSIADRFKKGKHLLLFSLFCWVFFTVTLTFISPSTVACIKYNSTHLVLTNPYSEDEYEGRSRRSLTSQGHLDLDRWLWQDALMDPVRLARLRPRRDSDDDDEHTEVKKHKYEDYLPFPTITRYGMSPIPLVTTHIVADMGELDDLVSPPFSSAVYNTNNVKAVFGILLFLMIIGEFFSAPAMCLADSATLGYLGDDFELYGRQRLFGSFGWAITMFFIGIALDHSTIFANHPCGNIRAGEKNYTVCFAAFSILMILAFIVATQFHFEYDGIEEKIQLGEVKEIQAKIKGKIQEAVVKGRGLGKNKMEDGQQAYPNQGTEAGDPNYKGDPQIKIMLDGEEDPSTSRKEKIIDLFSPFIPRGKPGQSGTMPGWITVLGVFANYKHGAVLYLTWFMGFGVGFMFTFLFWHLQDIGGGPTLFGMASVINHVSEVAAYFFSKRLIMSIGHIKVLYLGLCGNIARFLYISWLRSPWWILPFEFVQGLTHATVWAACCSYITQACPEHLQSSAQIIMQGIHHGLGRGCGALIGGILVYNFGTEYTFRGYGIACIVILVVYAGLNCIFRDKYYGGDKPDSDPHEMLEESSQLAPCGVPMNPMSRNLSSSKLNEHAQQTHPADQYGSTKTTNGFLDTSNRAPTQDIYKGGQPGQTPAAGLVPGGISVRVPTTTGTAPYSQGPPPERPAAPVQTRRPATGPPSGGYKQQRPADYDAGRGGSYDQRPDYDAPSAARSAPNQSGGYDHDQSRGGGGGNYDQSGGATQQAPRRSNSRDGYEQERVVDRQQHRVPKSSSRDKEFQSSLRQGSYGYDQ